MISRKIKFITIIFFLFCITGPFITFAHPHLFIENAFTFVFSNTELKGLKIKWIFDEVYSASTIMDFDMNRNSLFEENEIKEVERNAFSNLENYDYFMHININNSKFNIATATDFKAEIVDGKIIYYFFIPLNLKTTSTEQSVTAGSFDDQYFCYVFNSETDPVKLENNSLFESSWKIIEDKENSYWGDTIIPKVVLLKFRNKNE